MFAVYHGYQGQLVAVDFGKLDSNAIVNTIRANGCGLDGKLGNYFGVDAEDKQAALAAYRQSVENS